MRIKFVNWICALVFLFLLGELINLTLVRNRFFRELSKKNCIRLISQRGSRGNILSREGEVLAGTLPSYDVMVLPKESEHLNRTLAELARVIDMDIEKVWEIYTSGYVSPSIPVTILQNVDRKKAIAIEEAKTSYDGIVIQSHPLRIYPFGKIASHVLGYLDEIDHWRLTKLTDYGYKKKDKVGFGGVEERYDYYLREEDGGLSVEVDRRGKITRVLGFKPPRSGKDIRLTLNLKLQKIVEDVLGSRKGCVVIMEPRGGEVLAMKSGPDFDPRVFIKKSSREAVNKIFKSKDALLLNRAIKGVYPPGSIFKVVVAAALLETGKIDPSINFLCEGKLTVGGNDFGCWNVHGKQDLREALAHSCNVYFYKAGLQLGPQLIHDYAVKFGLSKPTSIELPYESGGLVPSVLWKKIYRFKNWFKGDTANFSIGQGDLLVTPLQMARMMAVFANDGHLVRPVIIDSIDNEDVLRTHKKMIDLRFKKSTIEIIRQGLRSVVQERDGTAHVLSELAVPVAGKTGTAQVKDKLSHGWFVGFFPFKNPRYVICVFLENGGSGHNAAVLTKEIIELMVKDNLI